MATVICVEVAVRESTRRNIEKIVDTYAEGSKTLYCRLLITAERGLTEKDTNDPHIEFDPLRAAAYRATGTPSGVFGDIEGGIEKWMSAESTPDGREGVIVQFSIMLDGRVPVQEQIERFYEMVSKRIRQDVISAPGGTTRVYDCMEPDAAICFVDTEEKIGSRCGRESETFPKDRGIETVNLPLMCGFDFKIDRKIGIGYGISTNFWILSSDPKAGRFASNEAVRAVQEVDGVMMQFYACPSGSAAKAGAPTNAVFCPSLRDKPDSEVPEGVGSIFEIVMHGVSLSKIKEAVKAGISAVLDLDCVKFVSAGNYGGKIGQYKIQLRELFR